MSDQYPSEREEFQWTMNDLRDKLGQAEADINTYAETGRKQAQTIAALQDENARLKAEAADFQMDYRTKCDVETKALHAELATLRADADRREREAFMGGLNCPFEPNDELFETQEAQAEHCFEVWKTQHLTQRKEQ